MRFPIFFFFNYFVLAAQLLSRVQLFAAAWNVAVRLLCPWTFPGKNTVVLPFPIPGHLPDPGIEPKTFVSPVLQVDSLPLELLLLLHLFLNFIEYF